MQMKSGTLEMFAPKRFLMNCTPSDRASRSCAEIVTAIMSGPWLSILFEAG